MATKLKGWTTRRGVKIFCVILIPILLFISMAGVVGLAGLDYFSADILLADLNKNDFFFDNYVYNTEYRARSVFFFQSEEHIRNMGCLEWRAYEDYKEFDPRFGREVSFYRYELVSTNTENQWHFGSVSEEDIDTPYAARMVEEAIYQQLREFYYAKDRLDETPGLFRLVTDGERWAGNVPPDTGADFFRRQPVYRIAEPGKSLEQSNRTNSNHGDGGYGAETAVYIAFSGEMVDWQNNVWRAFRTDIETRLMIITLPAIVALALFIILLAGAGRRYGGEPGKIYFTVLDRPWTDVGFYVLAVFEGFLCYFVYETMSFAWRYENMRWIYALCAVTAVFFTLPVLGWILSFVKRCKAGKPWRYTLVYTLTRWTYTRLRRLIKSLWAGVPLTVKAGIFGCALFAVIVICAAAPPRFALVFGLIVTASAVFGLLRYFRKLNMVDLGAKKAAAGNYDTPVTVTGGELGSIAASINNISAGINAAVAERLKSERLKTELITNISHDIRTPITSLITYTDLIKNEGLTSERAPEYLDVLIQKSARLKTLTDDLFEASKAASGNIEVHPENLDLTDLVRQVLGESDERVRGSGLDFRLNLPDRAPVYADGKLLLRVMENLLSNVFKYALTDSRVYIDVTPQGGSYRLDIKNISAHPLNIDPSELTERFKRGDEARGGEGSGLGLSIAQSFMQLQGGRFEVSIDGDLFKVSLHPASARS
ncbi:MAG: HAMP domain-containing histidine kinase [Oscillospiraceae bacterium]|nr:HAMP domain-containing histidine kinase [Oscillospiraceae bacterium]